MRRRPEWPGIGSVKLETPRSSMTLNNRSFEAKFSLEYTGRRKLPTRQSQSWRQTDISKSGRWYGMLAYLLLRL